MRSWRLLSLAITAAAALLASPALAQSPTALIQEGLPLPGGPVEHLVVSINNPAVNHSGGYAFNVNTSDGLATLSRFWGAGTVLRTEGTYGVFAQTAWESFYGLGGGNVLAYSPTCDNSQSGSTGLDGVWLDDVPVAVEEEVYPWAAGFWWSFGSRPGVTEDGVPYWVGGITDVQGGSTDNRGLFYGLDAQPLLLGGQSLPGIPAPLATVNTPSFDYRFSAHGTHYLAEVETTEPTAVNNYLVVDGAALLIEGAVVGEGRPVPVEAGGLPFENWDNFDFVGITENGRYMFTGDTETAVLQDEIVVVDGAVVLREGDPFHGWQLAGSISAAYLNEDGDYAVAWEVLTDTGLKKALIFNGEVILMEGDPVDLDGDGVPEGGTALLAVTGISALVLSDRDPGGVCRLYFTADVDVVPVRDLPQPTPLLFRDRPEELGYEGEIPPPDGSRVAVEMGLVLPTATVSTPVDDAPRAGLTLVGAYPNPFNPLTRVTFSIDRPQRVRLSVFDASGRRVAVIADQVFTTGTHTRTWNATDATGARLPSGAYVARLEGENDARVVKLLLLK